ncbi:uncharacterized protein LOC110996128 [Pieris rapae]|uniref:uncharacterized protein LOC110996128 n=1 Tax=Pieris rapae TaxID=64459 RepID=UPI001E27C193|nr:uncharacterized protein LOC110996128 [Pieris rapae]
MDIHETQLKEDWRKLITNLQKYLPKKKDILVLKPRVTMTRLSDVHGEAKNVFPQCFAGTKLVIYKDVMNKVKLVQNYSFGKSKAPHTCYSRLIHKEMEVKNSEEGLVVDLAGSATATYRETLEDNLEIRMTTKIRDLVSSDVEAVLEKETDRFIGSVSFGMKDVDVNTSKYVIQCMYKAMPGLSFGSEFGHKPLSLAQPWLSFSLRYDKPSFTVSSTYSMVGFQTCFYKQFAQKLRIATIVNKNHGGQTTLSVALNKICENGTELKMFVNSQLYSGFTVEKDVFFQDVDTETRVVRLLASTLIDGRNRVRFGFGVHLDF